MQRRARNSPNTDIDDEDQRLEKWTNAVDPVNGASASVQNDTSLMCDITENMRVLIPIKEKWIIRWQVRPKLLEIG